MDQKSNCEEKTIAVALIVFDIYETTGGVNDLLSSKVLHGFANQEDCLDYLDQLEETFRGYRDMDLTVERPNNEHLIIRYEKDGHTGMNSYHVELTQIYY